MAANRRVHFTDHQRHWFNARISERKLCHQTYLRGDLFINYFIFIAGMGFAKHQKADGRLAVAEREISAKLYFYADEKTIYE